MRSDDETIPDPPVRKLPNLREIVNNISEHCRQSAHVGDESRDAGIVAHSLLGRGNGEQRGTKAEVLQVRCGILQSHSPALQQRFRTVPCLMDRPSRSSLNATSSPVMFQSLQAVGEFGIADES
jgi:hypothetical protein